MSHTPLQSSTPAQIPSQAPHHAMNPPQNGLGDKEPDIDADADVDAEADADADGSDAEDQPRVKRQRMDTPEMQHQDMDHEAVLALAAHNSAAGVDEYAGE